MGTLTLPSSGHIYLDSSAIIYSVERIEPHFSLLAPAWQQAEAGHFTVVCSELVIAETLVRPIREHDLSLAAAFRSLFASREMQLIPATRQLWDAAAHLRAYTGLKTPDALHAVTAQQVGCALFVTNDSDFRRVERLPLAILDDLLGDVPPKE